MEDMKLNTGPVSNVGWVCCWFSSLLQGFFSGFSSFHPSRVTNTPNFNLIQKCAPKVCQLCCCHPLSTLLSPLCSLKNWDKFAKLKRTVHRRHFMQHIVEMTVITTKHRTQNGSQVIANSMKTKWWSRHRNTANRVLRMVDRQRILKLNSGAAV